MTKNSPDERLVYLALRGILQGENAGLRKLKKVKKIVEKYQNQADIKNLAREFKLESICQVAVDLLKDRVFESTLRAKARFPEVFEVSPTQTAKRAISESEAAKHEDAAISSVVQGQQQQQQAPGHKPTLSSVERNETDRQFPSQQTQPLQEKTPGPSFYPVYLPFNIQHQLLVRVQNVMERACYAFALRKLAGVLQKEGWDCAEAVELNRWPGVLRTYETDINLGKSGNSGKSTPDLLSSMIQLRHAAVHRMRLTANRVLQFIADGEALANLLHEESFVAQLSAMRRQTQNTIEELERHKDLLGTKLEEIKKQTAAKIAELKRQELEAVENTMKEDRDYVLFAGKSLAQALNTPTTVVHSPIDTEDESCSDTDMEQTIVEEDG